MSHLPPEASQSRQYPGARITVYAAMLLHRLLYALSTLRILRVHLGVANYLCDIMGKKSDKWGGSKWLICSLIGEENAVCA